MCINMFIIKEEDNLDESKELNPDALEEALGDVTLIEDDDEEVYLSISPDDDLDIAFIDDDTRDWI